jgi:hypothetical protein
MSKHMVVMLLVVFVSFFLSGCGVWKHSWVYNEVQYKRCQQCMEKNHMDAKICKCCKSSFREPIASR